MKFTMNNSIISRKDKKFLLWTLYDINEEEEEENLMLKNFVFVIVFWTGNYLIDIDLIMTCVTNGD